MRLTTSRLDPARATALTALPAALRQQLPADYVEFITTYGTGTYASEVAVVYPDPAVIPDTFGELADLWELDERFTEADLQAATQLAYSANGDSVCVAPRRPGQVFVPPRHAERVAAYPAFQAAVAVLAPTLEELVFDPDFAAVVEQVSLVRANRLLPIEPVWEAFRAHYAPAVVLRTGTQHQCLLPALGGWVSFDLVHKSSITVKYQQPCAAEAAGVLAFLRGQLPDAWATTLPARPSRRPRGL